MLGAAIDVIGGYGGAIWGRAVVGVARLEADDGNRWVTSVVGNE